jgi:hypothetical protein
MSLDELKTTWKQYDLRLQSTQLINEKIIVSMIVDRSDSRLSRVKRKYTLGIAWMLICLAAGVAVWIGNPFDYRIWFQYIPIVLYVICLGVLTAKYIYNYSILHRVNINHSNVQSALQQIITIYERPGVFMRYTLFIFLFSQFFLFPMSFLPSSIERMGLWPALAERLIPIFISLALFALAFKLGAFKQRERSKFKQDLSELEELKLMSRELKSA